MPLANFALIHGDYDPANFLGQTDPIFAYDQDSGRLSYDANPSAAGYTLVAEVQDEGAVASVTAAQITLV